MALFSGVHFDANDYNLEIITGTYRSCLLSKYKTHKGPHLGGEDHEGPQVTIQSLH